MDDARTGSQSAYEVRLEWGAVGGPIVAAGCDVAVVVDVLSFTTTLSVAADRGTQVIPCPWHDERARDLARRHDAALAVGRAASAPGQVSLPPGSARAPRARRPPDAASAPPTSSVWNGGTRSRSGGLSRVRL